jgi:hypothetical protein
MIVGLKKNIGNMISLIFENSTDTDFFDHGHLKKKLKKIGKLIFDKVKKEIKCIK